GTLQADQLDELPGMLLHFCAVPGRPARGHGEGDVAHYREPRQQGMALEDDGAVEAGAIDLAIVDDHRAFARAVEAGQHVQDRGLAAAGMADQAHELAAIDAEPQVLEYRRAGVAEATGEALYADQGALLHRPIPGRSRAGRASPA